MRGAVSSAWRGPLGMLKNTCVRNALLVYIPTMLEA